MTSTKRTRRAPKGRSVLAWAAGLFLASQLVASLLFDYQWPQVRFPELHERLARTDLKERSPAFLALGTSRLSWLLDEAAMTELLRRETGDENVRFFNAWMPWGDPITSERVFQKLLEQGVKPRFVLIEMCPEAVNQRNGYFDVHLVRELCWDDAPAALVDAVRTGNVPRFLGTRLLPCFAYRDPARRYVRDWALGRLLPSHDAPKANAPLAADWQPLLAASRHDGPAKPPTFDSNLYERPLRHYHPGGWAAAALERTLARCRACGAEPILVGVPLTSVNRNHHTAAIEDAYRTYVAGLIQTYGCRYVEYQDLLPDHYFVDPRHASVQGRALFSAKLAAEVLTPAWTEVVRREKGPSGVEAVPVSRTGS